MSNLVKPLGGVLKPLLLEGLALTDEKNRAATLPQINITSREAGDLFMMGIGGFTPLDGFMTKADWCSVCDNYKLINGIFWPIPVTLSTDTITADSLSVGDDVALINDEDNELVATLTISEKYSIDKSYECKTVYKTTDINHPGVKMVMNQGDINLAGSVKVLSLGGFPELYGDQFMTPAQTRAAFKSKGWKTIAAFQTRNPMHRSHEYLVKVALETLDGALIHSTLGKLKEGDIPAKVRSNAIQTLIDKYFVENTVIQAGYPLDMRFAGPREALLHAAFRQNYGCSHLIVGRDHAGVGDYYGAFDAHQIFNEIDKDALEIEPLRMDWTWWCDECDGMSSMKTCPKSHGDNGSRLLLSGTKLRKALSEGEEVSTKFSRYEVLEILRTYYASIKDEDKIEIKMSGHSAK